MSTEPTLMIINSVKDGKYMQINNNFVHVTEYSQEGAIGASPIDLVFLFYLQKLHERKNNFNETDRE